MDWYHTAKKEWLEARKLYLSSSDIKKLIPVTATGRPRNNMTEAYLKVWAEKQSFVSYDDVTSRGVMARGHILEPFAVTEFNKHQLSTWMYHWDDVVIHTSDGVSCSPDSLNIKVPLEGYDFENTAPEIDGITTIGEIKAYNAATHYATGMTDKMKLDERWQIATAMYVMPSASVAWLILFNPNTEHPLFTHEYTRADLVDELTMIEQVAKDYWKAVEDFNKLAENLCPVRFRDDCISEQEIIDAISEVMSQRESLNP